MRILQITAFFIALALFGTSCKKEDNGLKIPGGNIFGFWAGLDSTITLPGKAPFTVTVEKPGIANGTIDGDKLHITTGAPGVGTLRIKDADNRTVALKVISGALESGWRRGETALPSAAVVVVETGDNALTAEIKTALTNVAAKQVTDGYKLLFLADNKFKEGDNTGVKAEGTYTFDAPELKLTTGGKVRTFRIPFNLVRVDMVEDLTAHYHGLYPDKNVTKVTVTTQMLKVANMSL